LNIDSLESSEKLDGVHLARLVKEQQVRQAIEQLRRMPVLHFMVDLGCVLVMSRTPMFSASLVWLALITICQTFRSAYFVRLNRIGTVPPDKMLMMMGITLGLQGILASFVIVLAALQPDINTHYIISVIMVGVAAGAITPAAGHRPIFITWAVGFGGVVSASWIYRGNIEGYVFATLMAALLVLFSTYVSDQRKTLVKLVELASKLRRERDLVNAERLKAEAAHRQAEAANQSRTRFFAAASHDLRQPLHALGINVATVQALAEHSQDETLSHVGDVIKRALNESRGLLDSILEVSELDAGAVKAELRSVQLHPLLQEVYELCSPLAKAKGLAFDLPDLQHQGLWLCTDAALLKRMLSNLIGNAIKFTGNGRISLEVKTPEQFPEHAFIQIHDTGRGIPPDERERIFEEFYQLGNMERDRSRGLGLGLAIVRRLSELIGADTYLSQSSALGSTFEIKAQLAKRPAQVHLQEQRSIRETLKAQPLLQGLGYRILIVDDEREVRDSVSTLLRIKQWEARAVSHLAQAVALVSKGWQPDALILDFRLQEGHSGLDVLQALKGIGCEAPAVLVTGDTAPERIQTARAAGIPILYKPVDGQQLLELLHRIIREQKKVDASSTVSGADLHPPLH
jgi:two-component system, sensor histidine kinase